MSGGDTSCVFHRIDLKSEYLGVKEAAGAAADLAQMQASIATRFRIVNTQRQHSSLRINNLERGVDEVRDGNFGICRSHI